MDKAISIGAGLSALIKSSGKFPSAQHGPGAYALKILEAAKAAHRIHYDAAMTAWAEVRIDVARTLHEKGAPIRVQLADQRIPSRAIAHTYQQRTFTELANSAAVQAKPVIWLVPVSALEGMING